MSKNEKTGKLSVQTPDAENKQIEMTVDGCIVKINFLPNQSKTAKIETVKRMILNGLAKV